MQIELHPPRVLERWRRSVGCRQLGQGDGDGDTVPRSSEHAECAARLYPQLLPGNLSTCVPATVHLVARAGGEGSHCPCPLLLHLSWSREHVNAAPAQPQVCPHLCPSSTAPVKASLTTLPSDWHRRPHCPTWSLSHPGQTHLASSFQRQIAAP